LSSVRGTAFRGRGKLMKIMGSTNKNTSTASNKSNESNSGSSTYNDPLPPIPTTRPQVMYKEKGVNSISAKPSQYSTLMRPSETNHTLNRRNAGKNSSIGNNRLYSRLNREQLANHLYEKIPEKPYNTLHHRNAGKNSSKLIETYSMLKRPEKKGLQYKNKNTVDFRAPVYEYSSMLKKPHEPVELPYMPYKPNASTVVATNSSTYTPYKPNAALVAAPAPVAKPAEPPYIPYKPNAAPVAAPVAAPAQSLYNTVNSLYMPHKPKPNAATKVEPAEPPYVPYPNAATKVKPAESIYNVPRSSEQNPIRPMQPPPDNNNELPPTPPPKLPK